MILIVESGTTKSDWVFVTEEVNHSFVLDGINPTLQQSFPNLSDHKEINKFLNQCSKIYYYGAGVSSQRSKDIVIEGLKPYAPEALIEVKSDIFASARACFGIKPGIACILGTGSNVAYFDGEEMHSIIPSMGYILGDEGGGSHIGRLILQSYFQETMPVDVRDVFEKLFHTLKRDEVLTKVYKDSTPAAFLASFASFGQHFKHPWLVELYSKAFEQFVCLYLLPAKKKYAFPVKIVGSIAYLHSEIINNICLKYGFEVEEFIPRPIDRLIDYHKKMK
jgi:N-acetylglucosamine kinase-like BadF-type ATPase